MDLLPHLPECHETLLEALSCQHLHAGAGTCTLASYARLLLSNSGLRLDVAAEQLQGDSLEILDALASEPCADVRRLASNLAHAEPGDVWDPAAVVADIFSGSSMHLKINKSNAKAFEIKPS